MKDRYRLERLFARGGMAEVYLGVATGAEGFEKPVAVKRVLPHLANDERMARMFVSEAKLATVLHHQNIVSTLDVGRGPDGLFIVMELIEGWDLSAVLDAAILARRPFPPELAAFVAAQVMAGLCYAYRRTHQGKPVMTAHRDVSGSNVLISREGEVKVTDFGIARVEDASDGTEPGTFKGKIAYSAPEILNRQPATPLSDLFSVGILLHEMLTLRHPFGEPKDLLDYLERMQTAKAPTLTEIPLELAETVRRALQPDPSVRFESPEALAKSLALFLARAGRPAGPAELAHFLQGLNLAEPLSANAGAGPLASTFVRGFSLHAASKAGFPLDNDWKTTGPSLDASGRLTREPPRIEPAPGALGTPPPRPEPVLELAAAPARTTVVARTQNVQFGKPVNAAPGPGPRRTPWLALLAAVGLGAAGVLYGPKLWKEARGWVKAPTGALTAAPILSIDSEPSGAQVTINKKVIGTTPLFRENDFPDAPVEVMVSASGYRPWRGTFRGGKTAQLKAKLIRRGR